MKELNNYLFEKLRLNKDTEILLDKKSFMDYIKSDLNGDIFHVDNEEANVYMVHLKDYKNVCDGGYPVPRFDFEFEDNCFRFYGDEAYYNGDGEVEDFDASSLENSKYKGEYKYSIKNAEILINTLKEKE